QFLAEPVKRSMSETKSLPASGVIGGDAATRTVPAGDPEKSAPATTASSMHALPPAEPAANPAPVQPVSEAAADSYVPADNSLAFVDLKDQDVLPFAQTNIRVKGNASASLYLKVNGKTVSVKRVGTKSLYSDKQAAVWEYIGIALKPGVNEVRVEEVDGFGNTRGSKLIHLVAPNKLGKLHIDLPET